MKKDDSLISPFVAGWLIISAVTGISVLLCLWFQTPIIAFAKSIWPYFDLI